MTLHQRDQVVGMNIQNQNRPQPTPARSAASAVCTETYEGVQAYRLATSIAVGIIHAAMTAAPVDLRYSKPEHPRTLRSNPAAPSACSPPGDSRNHTPPHRLPQ